jgi:hypothetical protein
MVAATVAQQPAGPPQPGPEHKRLGYFIGKWTSSGDMKASAFGPGGPFNITETCEWLAGGFSIVCRSEGKIPLGEAKGISIMSYNSEEKRYEYYAANNIGMVEFSRGTVKGKEWDWSSESKMGGKPVKSHFILKEETPTTYSYKFEMSTDGAPMSVVMEGKSTKTK